VAFVITAAHVTVRGVVQGVGFRMSTKWEADRLGVRGYVRNLPGGAVEIVAEGRADAVDRLIAWAKHGPPGAVVEDVTVEEGEATGAYRDFGIQH
jgi:acylphosphatase